MNLSLILPLLLAIAAIIIIGKKYYRRTKRLKDDNLDNQVHQQKTD